MGKMSTDRDVGHGWKPSFLQLLRKPRVISKPIASGARNPGIIQKFWDRIEKQELESPAAL